jgi:hypothetical protein
MRKMFALVRRRPLDAVCAAIAIATAVYVIVGPFLAARYPMMTDLPFHAANASILRHYWDPEWHFREQFVLRPLAVPYLSMYVVAALLMSFMSPLSAIKVAAVVMLVLLPIGLSVLAWGMGKSPLLGVAGLSLVWCGLSNWGFLNFLGALGLFAAALGLALAQLRRPRAGLGVALEVTLVLLLATHPFRFPFAIAAVVASVVLFAKNGLRARSVLWPLVLPLALFLVWWLIRPPELALTLKPLQIEPARLGAAREYLYRSLLDPREREAADAALEGFAWLAVALAVLGVVERRANVRWQFGSTLVVLASAGVFLLLYLSLPMEIGVWWYVYPREITAAAYVALAAIPDLPRARVLRVGAVMLLCWLALPLGRVVIDAWRGFDRSTEDFSAIVEPLPRAPKLLYLVFDHSGSGALRTPFIHFPAYVQAEKGGWLSFQFAMWGAGPIAYRARDEADAVVPPPVPLRWEWTPEKFDVRREGVFFDWFLVRSKHDPGALFDADRSIELAAHEGRWWLYRRIISGAAP